MSVGLTALAFVQERKEGLLERSLVSGKYFDDSYKATKILIEHFLKCNF